MKKIIKDFIPPVFFRLLKSRFQIKIVENTKQIFENYQDALKACTEGAYEEEELVEIIYKKTKFFSENINFSAMQINETSAYSLIALINPIIDNKSNQINVLDFGGACGAHYFQLKKLVNCNLKINWVVVETPMMVKYGKKLENEELTFCDNFEDALNKLKTIDLLHTSGTLQCVDDPANYLKQVVKCNAKWMLFNRLGLNKNDKDIITIHTSKLSWNGIGDLPEGHSDRWISYPFNFQSETKFLNMLKDQYSVVAKFNDITGMYPVAGQEILGYGLLCKNKTLLEM